MRGCAEPGFLDDSFASDTGRSPNEISTDSAQILLHCVDITGECLDRRGGNMRLLLLEKVISLLVGH